MQRDYDVDTDVLRSMATRARHVVTELDGDRVAAPANAGHEWVAAASADFAEAWSTGLADRVTDSYDFADRLDTTARVFDEGTDAARAEIDAMIWDS